MLRLYSLVEIETDEGTIQIKNISEYESTSSIDTITDTATLVIPRKLSFKGRNIVAGENPLIKRGQRIKVFLGYFPNLNLEFDGYISDIKPDTPITLELQDLTYILKESNLTKSYKEVTLEELLKDTVADLIPYQADDVKLGEFRITRANIAQVLEELQKTYGLKSYMRDGTLYVGLAFRPELRTDHILKFEANIVDHDLIYKKEDDVKLKIVAISIQPDNTKLEEELGDPNGDTRTLTYYNLSRSELKKRAEAEKERLIYEGYRGEVTSFGEPFIRQNDAIEFISDKLPERNGKYLVREVVTTFGSGGFRKTSKPDIKIG